MTTVKDKSFLTFVYPITFESNNFDSIVNAVKKTEITVAKKDQDGNIIKEKWKKVWESETFPHQDLLPHVADYLNPQNDKTPTARIWKMTNDVLDSPKGLGNKADWHLVIENKLSGKVSFKFDNVSLYMFRVGIGFLVFQITPKSKDLTNWLDLLHYFRFTKRDHYLIAERKTGRDTPPESFFPLFASGIPDKDKPKKGAKPKEGNTKFEERNTLSQIIFGLFNLIGNNSNVPQIWWDEIFIPNQMLGYSAISIESSSTKVDDSHLLYNLRNFFPSGKDLHPSEFDLSPDHPCLLEYGKQQWFHFSLDGGGFLAWNSPNNEFFNSTLPNHLRQAYFHIFIIALHQRFALMSMSHEVAEKWMTTNEDKSGNKRVETFEDIRDKFLIFTARGYFAQIMQSEHHHRCYRKWQETFELQRLYDEVREEVREMYEWSQLKQTERLEKIAKTQADLTANFERNVSFWGLLIALGIGVPSLITSFLGIDIVDVTDYFTLNFENTIYLTVATLIISSLFALVIFILLDEKSKTIKTVKQNNKYVK